MDNDYVVWGDRGTLYLYEIATGETRSIVLGGDIIYPKISDHTVVYYDFSYMGFKLYDIETTQEEDLLVTNWEGGESDAFQFYGDYLVYEYYYPDLYSTEIFLYNIVSGETLQLTNNPGDEYSKYPCIYGNTVAWQFTEGNLNDIMMYNIDTTAYTRVTNTSQFASETFPSIYNDLLVYSYLFYDKVNGTIEYALKQYTISSGDHTTILTDDEPTGSTPEVYGSIVVYGVPGVSLRLHDLVTGNDTAIYEGVMLSYPWNLNNRYVLFTIVEDGVYLYKYNAQPEIQIEDILGGLFTVKATLMNTGDETATNVSWTITLTGGFILMGRESMGTVASIDPGASTGITSKAIVGFGKVVVTVTSGASTASDNAKILFIYVKILS